MSNTLGPLSLTRSIAALATAGANEQPKEIRLSMVPLVRTGSRCGRSPWIDPLLAELQKIFDADDAEHITLAVRSSCDYFLTLDEKTILSRVRSYSDRLNVLWGEIEFVNPEQLAKRLSTPSSKCVP
jgi:hypothetical protein